MAALEDATASVGFFVCMHEIVGVLCMCVCVISLVRAHCLCDSLWLPLFLTLVCSRFVYKH